MKDCEHDERPRREDLQSLEMCVGDKTSDDEEDVNLDGGVFLGLQPKPL